MCDTSDKIAVVLHDCNRNDAKCTPNEIKHTTLIRLFLSTMFLEFPLKIIYGFLLVREIQYINSNI